MLKCFWPNESHEFFSESTQHCLPVLGFCDETSFLQPLTPFWKPPSSSAESQTSHLKECATQPFFHLTWDFMCHKVQQQLFKDLCVLLLEWGRGDQEALGKGNEGRKGEEHISLAIIWYKWTKMKWQCFYRWLWLKFSYMFFSKKTADFNFGCYLCSEQDC